MIMATQTSNNSRSTTSRSARSRGRRTKGEASLEDLQEDLRVVTRDIAQLRADATGAVAQGVRQTAESALESAKAVTDRAKEAHSKAVDWVSDHPTTSVLVAIGVGALASRILTRR